MTENEAIKELKEAIECCTSGEDEHFKEALGMGILAIEEIQQYRAIGTIEEFKALKEKNVAKKPTPIDYEKYIDVVKNAEFLRGAYWCPNCKHTVISGTYCSKCGQKLDWQ